MTETEHALRLAVEILNREKGELRAEVKRLEADAKKWQEVASQGITIERELRAEVERLEAENAKLRAALEPFARNVDAVSLSATLGHITRVDLWCARDALTDPKP